MSDTTEVVAAAPVDRKEEKRFNSRKFMFSVGIWFAGTVGWATHLMTAAEWTEFSRWILTLYLIGNVSESALSFLRK
jgi:hypothetical protein